MAKRTQQDRKRRGAAEDGGSSRTWLVWGGAAVILVAVVAVFAVTQFGLGGDDSTGTPASRNIEAMDFEFTVYRGAGELGGEELNFSDVFDEGQPVVLNFWAGRCPPCRAEMPGIQNVYNELGDRFTLLGVDIGPFVGLGSRDDGRNLVEELNITYPTATTFDSSVVPRYKIRGMPTTVFLNADGEVLETHVGFLDSGTLRDKLQNVLQVSTGS